MIRDRPVAGILHALVMWGFLAFLWVSLEHFALGFRGLEHARASESWYGTFVAAWAVAVLVGIIGLAFRRFVLRPAALGPLSPTSGIVAGLIALLMGTYLAGWRLWEVGTPVWKANWWLHTLSFFAILIVIPKSKHLHLLLGPVTVFFRATNTSATRALRDDDDLGMVRFSDLTWKDVLQLSACVECGRCTDVCPAHAVGRSLSPKEVILAMQRGLRSGGELIAGSESEVAAGTAWVSERDLCQCFSCGACEEACAVGIEHVGSKILDLRRGLVSEGRIANEKIAGLFSAMERQPRNPWGMSRETREKFLAAEQFPIFDGSQEWLLWLGCSLSFDDHGRGVARSMKQVLEAAGVSWGVLAEETCCGEAARRLGNEYLYMELSEQLTGTFRQNGVKKLLTCCPHCTTMFDADYRQIPAYAELGIEVQHHAQFLAALVPSLPLVPEAAIVAYHDPCYLARARGVVDEPRAILSACGATVREMRRSRSRTFCCGAGGAQIFIEDDRQAAAGAVRPEAPVSGGAVRPEAPVSGGAVRPEAPPRRVSVGVSAGERVNHLRFGEILATGAETVAVACPYCPIMLTDAAHHANRDGVAILDIAELVASRLKKGETQTCTPKSFAPTVSSRSRE